MSNYKAQAMAQNVQDELAKRLSSAMAPVLGVTAGGDLSIKCGDGTAGDPNAFIVFTNFPTPLATNIVGLTAEEFAPCLVQLVTETLASGALIGASDWLNLLTTLVNAGARIDWYKSTNGTAPTAAAITGTPAASVYPSLYGGMRSTVSPRSPSVPPRESPGSASPRES